MNHYVSRRTFPFWANAKILSFCQNCNLEESTHRNLCLESRGCVDGSLLTSADR